ncbi:fibroleukin-like [Saccostrea cucullata]|uniref:fibroleukin-like n=1 Tax=Saccostrea cuccullata TaxID=36930 RepID=UPI002ED29E1B
MFATSTRKEIGTKNVEIMCDLRNVEEWGNFLCCSKQRACYSCQSQWQGSSDLMEKGKTTLYRRRSKDSLQQTLESLKREINTIKQNNTLQQTVEAPKREIDTLKQNNSLQQTVEAIKREIDTLKQNNTLQRTHIQQSLTRSEGKTMETDLKLTRDCRVHYLLGHRQSGVYNINPFGNETRARVYCDMETEGGGWTEMT